ncbi:hypoxanthine phosphoribosyltransferase [Mycoplasma enhydrae]|uniref:hypoxanthine phosphoribosyltransferase n=1 Tax=Mycoplasma enhydrae TaxID=2499220 RepID=UPI00197B3B28|nr:hypoxanthine phosphoribosyltransferase [Mycoplasma enhydrae]MBN4089491.1 hypoxanthine phosphoribosyltransferase [Mycoplasma enhydrae]MCV3733664.1 hypoxanthine phosphoribosyltransferase [Mycoplasma enhydrae]MCV3753355.1 hypoxanthine phosphoribosyltransferase [Mycoplasma enhydrae]
MQNQKIDNRIEKVLFSKEELENKIHELSQWVNEEYKHSNNLIIVGLLKGCLPFYAQLIKSIDIDFVSDFMITSSYEGTDKSSGNVKIILDLVNNIEDRDVLIVEDIIDTARTMTKVVSILKSRNPKSLKVLSLLNKPSGRIVKFEPDNFGFLVNKDDFVVGFGFDWEEKMRQLPYIGTIKRNMIKKSE